MCVRRAISFPDVNVWLRFSHRVGILNVQFLCVTAFRMDRRSTPLVGRIYGVDSVPNAYEVRLWRIPMPEITSSVRSFVQFIRFPLVSWVMWLNSYCRLFLSSLPIWDHHVVCVQVCVGLSMSVWSRTCVCVATLLTYEQLTNLRKVWHEHSAITDHSSGMFISFFSQ